LSVIYRNFVLKTKTNIRFNSFSLFRLFSFIDEIANDNSASASESAALGSNCSRISNTVTDENVTQVHMIQMLQVLFNQSSKGILKVNLPYRNLI
jgi:hypothetical protein